MITKEIYKKYILLIIFISSIIANPVIGQEILPIGIKPPPPPSLPPPDKFDEIDLLKYILFQDISLIDSCSHVLLEVEDKVDTLTLDAFRKKQKSNKNKRLLFNPDTVESKRNMIIYKGGISKREVVKAFFYNKSGQTELYVRYGDDSIASEKVFYNYSKKGYLERELKYEYWSQNPDSVLEKDITYTYKRGVKHSKKTLRYFSMCSDCYQPITIIRVTYYKNGNVFKVKSENYNKDGDVDFRKQTENYYNREQKPLRFVRYINDLEKGETDKKEFFIEYSEKNMIKVKMIWNEEVYYFSYFFITET